MQMKLIFFLILIGMTPVSVYGSINFTDQLIAVEQNIENISNSVDFLKITVDSQDQITQEKLFVISNDLLELQKIDEINEQNLIEIQEKIKVINNKISEITTAEVGVYGKDKDVPVFVDVLEDFYPETLLDVALIVSSIASIILVLIVYKQTQTAKKDSEVRYRPWIRIEDVRLDERGHVESTSNKIVKWSKHWEDGGTVEEIKKIIVGSGAFNGGALPTGASRIQSKFSLTELNPELLRKIGSIFPITPIMPQETQLWKYSFSRKTFEKSFSEPFYLGAECIYKVDENTTHRIGKIWKITGSSGNVEKYWFDELSKNYEDVLSSMPIPESESDNTGKTESDNTDETKSNNDNP